MSERLELLGLVDNQRLLHPAPWAVLHIETPLSSVDRGCRSAIEDCNRAAGVRADEARGRVAARLLGERATNGVRFRLAADDEEDLARTAERGQRERDAVDPRFEPGFGADNAPVGQVERGLAGEERSD